MLLLLPAVTGLAVMGVRLRMSEAEQSALDTMPPPGRFNAARNGGGSSSSSSSFPSASSQGSSSNGRFSFLDGGSSAVLHKHSYQEMRERNRDRLPKWARRALKAMEDFFAKDPVLRYILSPGPAAWTYGWLMHGRRNPAPLWDAQTFGPQVAEYPWGSADQLCSILNSTDDVALVGNGPLTDEQREEISRAGRVVRFNALNNRCAGHLRGFALSKSPVG